MENEQPIEVACQACGLKLRVRQRGAGKTVKCSNCSSPVKVPFPPPVPPATALRDTASEEAPEEILDWLSDFESEIRNAPQYPKAFEQRGSSVSPTEQPSFPTTTQAAATSFVAPVVSSSGNDMAVKLPSERTYPVLVIFAKISRIAGYIILAVAIFFLFVSFLHIVVAGIKNGEKWVATIVTWVTTSLLLGGTAIFGAAGLIMNAEVIELAMHVQSNTLATAHSTRALRR